MEEGSCGKDFPKPLSDQTVVPEDGYVKYRRRGGSDRCFKSTKHVTGVIDNRWVVPNNPWLSKKYDAHINVEICASIQSIKYVYKYIYKGHDTATITIEEDAVPKHRQDKDEIKDYQEGRYVCAIEACWRMFGFKLGCRSPCVEALAVHLENMQVTYWEHSDDPAVQANLATIAAALPPKTTLTGWFAINKETAAREAAARAAGEVSFLDPGEVDSRTLLYREMPRHFTLKDKAWKARKIGDKKRRARLGLPKDDKSSDTIGRVYAVSPKNRECFYFRMLLAHVRGATNHDDTKVYEGVKYPTFVAACRARGLLADDDEWRACLSEKVLTYSARSLRALFCTILCHCEPSDPLALWNEFRDHLIEDVRHRWRVATRDGDLGYTDDVVDEGLREIQSILDASGSKMSDFQLPTPKAAATGPCGTVADEQIFFNSAEKRAELSALAAKHVLSMERYNPPQLRIFDEVMRAVREADGEDEPTESIPSPPAPAPPAPASPPPAPTAGPTAAPAAPPTAPPQLAIADDVSRAVREAGGEDEPTESIPSPPAPAPPAPAPTAGPTAAPAAPPTAPARAKRLRHKPERYRQSPESPPLKRARVLRLRGGASHGSDRYGSYYRASDFRANDDDDESYSPVIPEHYRAWEKSSDSLFDERGPVTGWTSADFDPTYDGLVLAIETAMRVPEWGPSPFPGLLGTHLGEFRNAEMFIRHSSVDAFRVAVAPSHDADFAKVADARAKGLAVVQKRLLYHYREVRRKELCRRYPWADADRDLEALGFQHLSLADYDPGPRGGGYDETDKALAGYAAARRLFSLRSFVQKPRVEVSFAVDGFEDDGARAAVRRRSRETDKALAGDAAARRRFASRSFVPKPRAEASDASRAEASDASRAEASDASRAEDPDVVDVTSDASHAGSDSDYEYISDGEGPANATRVPVYDTEAATRAAILASDPKRGEIIDLTTADDDPPIDGPPAAPPIDGPPVAEPVDGPVADPAAAPAVAARRRTPRAPRAGRAERLFFIDAPAGTGKTYLSTALLAAVRQHKKIALCVAGSGIAATLLPGGRTAHSRFKIPINIHEHSTCAITKNSDTAKLIRNTSLIIWDEAPMTHKHCFEALDRTCRDVTGVDEAFGGKVVVFLGDFRQVLPIVPRGNTFQQIQASLRRSKIIWPRVAIRKLEVNMRVKMSGGADTAKLKKFADYLLKVGDGAIPPSFAKDHVQVPDDMCLAEPSEAGMVDAIYGELAARSDDPAYLCERAILTPLNTTVDTLNDRITKRFPGGNVQTMLSADEIADEGGAGGRSVSTEFLNTIRVSGMPPHKLDLKLGITVMLLRNVNPAHGHCNGTRYVLTGISRYVLEMRKNGTGETILVPRFMFVTDPKLFGFVLRRRQFPIRPAFAMTINKAQGQTLRRVGVFLPDPVFSHGQYYVAKSRVGNPEDITFCIFPSTAARVHAATHGGQYTRNVVQKEILRDAPSPARRGPAP